MAQSVDLAWEVEGSRLKSSADHVMESGLVGGGVPVHLLSTAEESLWKGLSSDCVASHHKCICRSSVCVCVCVCVNLYLIKLNLLLHFVIISR